MLVMLHENESPPSRRFVMYRLHSCTGFVPSQVQNVSTLPFGMGLSLLAQGPGPCAAAHGPRHS